MKTAIYARHINEESLEDQVKHCMRYAKKNNLFINPNHVYTDAALSDRTGLEKLMKAAHKGSIDTIIMANLSRFSRDVIHAEIIIQKVMNAGIAFHLVDINLATSNEILNFKEQLKNIFIEYHIDQLRRKTLRGKLAKKERGYFFVGEKSFGYKPEPVGNVVTNMKGKSRPEGYKMRIVLHEAGTVKRIFQMYANGKSINKIIKELNEEGIPSRKHVNNGWNISTIYRILRNEKYIGKWAWGKRQNTRNPITGALRQIPRPEGPLYEGFYEELRIIPQELWDQVQKRLQVPRKSGQTKKG